MKHKFPVLYILERVARLEEGGHAIWEIFSHTKVYSCELIFHKQYCLHVGIVVGGNKCTRVRSVVI
jgi:hypothetical protein